MKKIFSKSIFPLYVNIWLLGYIIINILAIIYFLLPGNFNIPYLALGAINIYALILLMDGNAQGLCTLLGATAGFVIYALFYHLTFFIIYIHLGLLCISCLLVLRFWRKMHLY